MKELQLDQLDQVTGGYSFELIKFNGSIIGTRGTSVSTRHSFYAQTFFRNTTTFSRWHVNGKTYTKTTKKSESIYGTKTSSTTTGMGADAPVTGNLVSSPNPANDVNNMTVECQINDHGDKKCFITQ